MFEGVRFNVLPQAVVIPVISAKDVIAAIGKLEAEYREFAEEGIALEALHISPFEVLADLRHALGVTSEATDKMKDYCTQNKGICRTCSLVNYGLDCENNPLTSEDDLYQAAKERINGMNFNPQEEEFIFTDWDNWSEHLAWLQTANREDIQAWIDAGK